MSVYSKNLCLKEQNCTFEQKGSKQLNIFKKFLWFSFSELPSLVFFQYYIKIGTYIDIITTVKTSSNTVPGGFRQVHPLAFERKRENKKLKQNFSKIVGQHFGF